MSVNTKKVEGRRKVRYESYDELLADIERLSKFEVRTLGNWSQGQIYEHLARAFNGSIDGLGFILPAPVRGVFTLLFKKKFLNKAIPTGFKSGAKFIPGETDTNEARESLRSAIARQKTESDRVPHPAFGKITREEWDHFHLRHAEMHMSFLVEA